MLTCESLAHVRRSVHDDRTIERMIVESGFQPFQTQRIAVLAEVGVFCGEQTDARTMRVGLVRKERGEVTAASTPVRDELLIQELVVLQIKDPQPISRGWFRVVNDGQRLGRSNHG